MDKWTKYKAHFEAKGYKQFEGLDYFESSAPVTEPEKLRILFQLSANLGQVIH